MMLRLLSFTLLLLGLLSWSASSLNPLEIKGYKFFDSETGEEVVIRGVDYYPRPNNGTLDHNSYDYYTNEHRHMWQRDIEFFKELGINAIRLYAVDAERDHDEFMCAMQAANIYVIVALAKDCPTCAITRDKSPDCYPPELKEQGQAVIKTFSKYPNTLAFSAGNEVNHFAPPNNPEWNGVCQKKFMRDMREFIGSCSTIRKVPVGLIVADSDRDKNVLYYNCQSDPDDEYENAEWFGLNSYVMCNADAETYEDALGLKLLQQNFERYNYSIPVLMTEFGCLSDTFPTVRGYEGQRTFMQAKWMLTQKDLRDTFAGSFAFEYSIEKANAGQESPYPFQKFGKQSYGIGYFEPEFCNDVNIPCQYRPLPSFDFLKEAFDTSDMYPPTTEDKFVVPSYRKGRTECPESFPSISSLTWDADEWQSLSCPPSPNNFVCPVHFDAEYQQPQSDCDFCISKRKTLYFCLAVVVAVLAYYACRNQKRRSKNYTNIDEKTSEGRGDSSSSTGLLNCPPALGGKYFQYQAVESDSSLDERTKLEQP
eukprot:scaffold1537_cov108-Cylindrotheca_fusiformis.AAC.7